jgi:hypothetical protein
MIDENEDWSIEEELVAILEVYGSWNSGRFDRRYRSALLNYQRLAERVREKRNGIAELPSDTKDENRPVYYVSATYEGFFRSRDDASDGRNGVGFNDLEEDSVIRCDFPKPSYWIKGIVL